jgi:hypothetical protein
MSQGLPIFEGQGVDGFKTGGWIFSQVWWYYGLNW